MRITGGEFCGRTIKVPRAGVRPTQDRVREALFSILMNDVPGSAFLDLYAGSGAVGLEAFSRGAKYVAWVENNRKTCEVLRHNVGEICGSVQGVVTGDVLQVLRKGLPGAPFDIIFADPPYFGKNEAGGHGSLLSDILGCLAVGDVFEPGGLVVFEQNSKSVAGTYPGWSCISERTYGIAKLCFYRKIG